MRARLPVAFLLCFVAGAAYADDSRLTATNVEFLVYQTLEMDIACEDDPQPSAVRVLSQAGVFNAVPRADAPNTYRVVVQGIVGVAMFDGTVEVKWNAETTENLRVAVPQVRLSSPVTLFFYNPDVTPNMDAIRAFKGRGLSGTNAFRTYFEARRVYRALQPRHPTHRVTVLAAFYWHEAAVALVNEPGSIVVMDDEARAALQKVQAHLTDDEVASEVRMALEEHGIRETYLAGILDQSAVLSWRYAANIARAANVGDPASAYMLNKYYNQKWVTASPEERDLVKKYYKIDEAWLGENDRYLGAVMDLGLGGGV